MKAIVFLALVACASALVVNKQNAGDMFKFSQFTVDFKKSYATTAEYDHAFHNFQAALKRIAAREAKGIKGYGVTKFSDLSPEEFRSRYLLPKGSVAQNVKRMRTKFATAPIPHGVAPPPATFNWVDQGATTPVKDQQQCGSCWAFSTTENFESMNWLASDKSKPPIVLGPQQLVDCDPQSQGCGGGWTYWAFEYLMSVGGQELEVDYPYTAEDGQCAFDASKIAAKLTNYTFATTPCESGSCPVQDNMLRTQMFAHGPVSVCVNAATWSEWTGPAPMTADSCPGDADELDHCVQLVGYNWPGQYWIVRNSWNTDWGQNGYIFLQTMGNTCGLGDVVTFADVPKSKH